MRARPRPRSHATVVVCGFGSIGRRHAANAAALGANVVVVTRHAASSARRLGFAVSTNIAAAISQADAVIIANPTDEHLSVAMQAARARKAIFVEKPLSNALTGLSAFVQAAQGLVVEVGCQLRAHPGLRRLKAHLSSGRDGRILAFRGCVGQRLDLWRPGTDYRQSYSAHAARGGGALFDLVHEVDLTSWLCGRIVGVVAQLTDAGPLDIEADDLANLIVACAGGCSGSLQLDMLSPVYRRSFEVVCERAVFVWDYVSGSLTRSTARGTRLIYRNAADFERNVLFKTHMRHFMRRLHDRSIEPLCSLDAGVQALRVLVAARQSAASGKWRTVR